MNANRAASHLPRHLSILILLFVGSTFAANHVAARIAFDDGAGLLLTILARSGIAFLALAALVVWQKQNLRLPAGTWQSQLLVGVLVGIQSLCVYSAVARIPVAIALLVANVFPILLATLSWALGGRRPTLKAWAIMLFILSGLYFVLDLSALIGNAQHLGPHGTAGVLFALGAACCFTVIMWVSEHKLAALAGPVRSFYSILVVVFLTAVIASTNTVEHGLSLPATPSGWYALIFLCVAYTLAFVSLFSISPRLNMAQNSPAMNIEPLTSLILGWVILNQTLNSTQLVGGAIVLSGIMLLAYQKQVLPPARQAKP